MQHDFWAAETVSLKLSLSAGVESNLRLMSDCEERDSFWESWISPGERKRKKHSQKDKQCVKHKNITMKTGESIQRKKTKKNSKFKEAMKGRKEKKKKKKEKKKKLSAGLDDSFIFTQCCSGAPGPVAKSKPSHSSSTEKLKPDPLTSDSKKKTKRKKKVAFDLSLDNIHIKRPKFVSSSPKQNICSERESVRDSESCSQITVTEHSQGQAHDNDSQCTSDDINSQDLFITQKMFRASPSEPSSGEASDKADVITTPQPVTQQKRGLHSSGVKIKRHEGSNTCLQDFYFYQNPKKEKEHLQRPKTEQIVLTEEEAELHFVQQSPTKETLSFQREMKSNTNFTEEKNVCGPVHVKPSVVNPYLGDPIVVTPPLDVAKSEKYSCTSSQKSLSRPLNTDEPSLLPQISKASISTQTENFFTTELCSYLKFCQKSGVTVCFENLKPLDLSLPQRARKDLSKFLSVKVLVTEDKDVKEKRSNQKTSSLPDKMKGNSHPKDPNLRPFRSSDIKDVEVKKEPYGQRRWSVSAQGKGRTTPIPQSESEPKSEDTPSSSKDNEPPCCTGKLDLTQVRAVQMRLNESFFFKTKGDGQALRPESPLMKLAQSRDEKQEGPLRS